jgi:predicted nucleotidyltransferase
MTAPELYLPIPINELRQVLLKNGVKRASVFGSYARGDATATSDLDLLVTYAPGTSLFDVIDLQEQLEAIAGTRVDLVSQKFIKPRLAKRIAADLVSLF